MGRARRVMGRCPMSVPHCDAVRSRDRSAGPSAGAGGGRSRRGRRAASCPGASCSLAIRGGSQTAGPYKWDSSPPNPADRWAGLSHARRR